MPACMADLSTALVGCGWDEAQLKRAIKQLDPRGSDGGLSEAAGVGAAGAGTRRITLDSFVECLVIASLYKSSFST